MWMDSAKEDLTLSLCSPTHFSFIYIYLKDVHINMCVHVYLYVQFVTTTCAIVVILYLWNWHNWWKRFLTLNSHEIFRLRVGRRGRQFIHMPMMVLLRNDVGRSPSWKVKTNFPFCNYFATSKTFWTWLCLLRFRGFTWQWHQSMNHMYHTCIHIWECFIIRVLVNTLEVCMVNTILLYSLFIIR